jgi:hypothetical protein
MYVRSGDYEKAYFVAADIEGPGLDGRQVGVWVTDDLGSGGLTYSVNDVAKEFSVWGDGGKTDAQFSMVDSGARAAETCVP